MKKLFILCGAVAIVAALTGNSATKVQKTKVVPRIIQLQDSCINLLVSHAVSCHGVKYDMTSTDNIEDNNEIIDSIANDLWFHHGCELSIFDGDIQILIEEEMSNLNNNN